MLPLASFFTDDSPHLLAIAAVAGGVALMVLFTIIVELVAKVRNRPRRQPDLVSDTIVSPSSAFAVGDRVMLLDDGGFLEGCIGVAPGTLGTAVSQITPDTCLVHFNNTDEPVNCLVSEIMPVRRVVELHVHRHARTELGIGVAAVDQRIHFERGASYLIEQLELHELESIASRLGVPPASIPEEPDRLAG